MQKEIVITIKRDGATTVEANNFAGQGCKDASKQFEMALAGLNENNTDTDPKPEMYQQDFSLGTNFGQ